MNTMHSYEKIDIEGKFIDQFNYVISNSPFYRNKFGELGINVNNNSNIIIEELPFTNKIELLDDQNSYPPYGSNLCVDFNNIQRIHRTSGTTNKPLIIALSKEDIESIITVGSKCYNTAGLTDKHSVIHCLNYNMWMGGFTDHQSLEETGATVIPFGVGNSKNLIDNIIALGINAISSTPSYLEKLEQVLKAEFNIKPINLPLELGLLGTESGLQDPKYREKLEETWGISAMNSNYGVAEVLSIFGSECKEKNGLHFISEGKLHMELIDPKTKSILSVEKGVIGEIVLTNLDKKSQPLLRYRTGDMVKILNSGDCQCGLGTFQFEVIGRSDDMLVIKGLNLFPSQIKSLISNHFDILTGQFRIILDSPPPLESLYLQVEYSNLCTIPEIAAIKNNLKKQIKDNFSITPIIEMLEEGVIQRTSGKSNLIIKRYNS